MLEVVVSRTFLKSVLDHLDRAERAASHATSISSSARTAFEEPELCGLPNSSNAPAVHR